MTTADNNVSEPPNLNIFWGTPPPPHYKRPSNYPRTLMSCTTVSDGVTWWSLQVGTGLKIKKKSSGLWPPTGEI